MTATTLPTSRPITQDWNQDFQWLNGRYYPNGFYASIGWKGHNGIDYGCWEGDPVEAVCDGVIEFAGNGDNHWLLSGGGKAILLRNDDLGVRFEYLHLSRFEVRQGQRVTRAQVIARSGNTGISSAPHLHIGAIPVQNVNVNNGYRGRIDPTPYLYGPLNPDYAGSGALGPAGTLTPQEDELSAEDVKAIGKAIDHAFQRTMNELPNLIARAIWSYANGESRDAYQILRDIPKDTVGFPVTYFKPGTAEPAGTTTIGSAAGNADLQHVASRQAVADAARAIVDSIKTTLGTDAGVAAEAAYEEFLKKLSTINLTISTGDSNG